MTEYKAISIVGRTAVAREYFLDEYTDKPRLIEGCNAQTECDRLNKAVSGAIDNLLLQKAKASEVGDECANIIDMHILLLSDGESESLTSQTQALINQKNINAEYALDCVTNEIAQQFAESESDYLRERSTDIRNVSQVVLNILLQNEKSIRIDEPTILVAPEVTPEMLMSIKHKNLSGIVTADTSFLSHAAIVARNLNIPFLTGVDIEKIRSSHGQMVVIDGLKSTFVVDLDESDADRFFMQMEEDKKIKEKRQLTDLPIRFFANIDSLDEISKAKENHAMGIGLFRSEFLFMGRDDLPSENEQYEAYVSALEAMEGKSVCVRTIDLGADKKASCIKLPAEENPALGTRGIRIGFAYPDVFETQLRALLRAAYKRNLEIMFPMITSKQEVIKAKEIVRKVASDLENEGAEYEIPKIGIMVETPAAALLMDSLAPLVDFVSIGTNDLTQYTLALDRNGKGLSEYYDPSHEAVFKLIEMTVASAQKHGIRVGICGELAADPSLTKRFADMGVDLSLGTVLM